MLFPSRSPLVNPPGQAEELAHLVVEKCKHVSMLASEAIVSMPTFDPRRSVGKNLSITD